jgi:hypothetical protein
MLGCVRTWGAAIGAGAREGARVGGDTGGVGVPIPRPCGEARRRRAGVGEMGSGERTPEVEGCLETGSVGTSRGESESPIRDKEPCGVRSGVGTPSAHMSCECPCEYSSAYSCDCDCDHGWDCESGGWEPPHTSYAAARRRPQSGFLF